MSNKIIWITWEKQIRNISMSSRIGAELCEIIVKASRPIRYIKSIIFTVAKIIHKRPNVIIAPNPSIVLGYSLLLFKKIFRFSLVTDAHFGGIEAFKKHNLFQKILNNYNSRADLVIVTNKSHAQFVESLGGKAFICPDPLPVLPRAKKMEGNFDRSVFLICSFDIDEPFKKVFEAANILKEKGYTLYVSGSYRKADIDPKNYKNIKFLGFIPIDEYYGYLTQCSVVIDLTEFDNCLLCGAYEALAAEKPLILSDKPALKHYFSSAAVFTDHSPDSIAHSIMYAYENREFFGENIKKWVGENNIYMASRIKSLKSLCKSL